MTWKHKLTLILLAGITIAGCRKKDTPAGNPGPGPDSTAKKGTVTFKISNVAGTTPIIISNSGSTVVPSDTFDLPGGERLTVSVFNYYLTNIVLVDDKGNRFAEPESYHLAVAADPASLSFSMANVPAGKYVMMEALIGVDSVRNFSGAQSGALDPVHGMIWSWSTGYIMAKIEGYSPNSKAPGGTVSYHIAGFKAPNSAIRRISLPLPQPATVSTSAIPVLHLECNLMTWFQAPGFKGLATVSSIGSEGPAAAAIADNYSTMLRITKVDN
jgi:hypothetical protein